MIYSLNNCKIFGLIVSYKRTTFKGLSYDWNPSWKKIMVLCTFLTNFQWRSGLPSFLDDDLQLPQQGFRRSFNPTSSNKTRPQWPLPLPRYFLGGLGLFFKVFLFVFIVFPPISGIFDLNFSISFDFSLINVQLIVSHFVSSSKDFSTSSYYKTLDCT